MANYIFHAAASRGHVDHGWLQSQHTFSFANYFNAERMHFGVLRVLNDDHVAAGKGFGGHPHDNMEIISIPLEGDLEHKDSIGNVKVIRSGDIQVMSAGTGVTHSEYNKNDDKDVKFLQIWVYPNQRNVAPRYDQLTLNPADRVNTIQQILSPNPDDEGVWIHQNAWFSLATFEAGVARDYKFKGTGTGVYLFNLSGAVEVDGHQLATRDALGITESDSIHIKATTAAEFLLMEVAMTT